MVEFAGLALVIGGLGLLIATAWRVSEVLGLVVVGLMLCVVGGLAILAAYALERSEP